jgi:hypothetical protein
MGLVTSGLSLMLMLLLGKGEFSESYLFSDGSLGDLSSLSFLSGELSLLNRYR